MFVVVVVVVVVVVCVCVCMGSSYCCIVPGHTLREWHRSQNCDNGDTTSTYNN